MRMRTFWMLLLCTLLAAAGCALAEEELLHDSVELYAGGYLPADELSVSTYGLSSFESYVLSSLDAQVEELNFTAYEMTLDEFRTAYRGLLNSRPEYFFVDGGFSYYPLTSEGYMTRVLPQYKYTGTELARQKAIYEEGLSAVLRYARQSDTDVGRLLRANDYICANYEYDTVQPYIYSPEEMFAAGNGVCQAYMLIMRAVANELGIVNTTATSEDMNHTWNMVYLDGDWYHIDVTWNDPTSDIPLRACHNNFLLSDAGISNAGSSGHYGWDVSVTAGNTKYDSYFWMSQRQPMAMLGDVVYYVPNDFTDTWRSIYGFNLATGSNFLVHTYDYGYGSYYQNYNPIWVTNQKIYYAVRSTLYAVPFGGGTPAQVYSTGDSSIWIWHPWQIGTNLQMFVASTPYAEGEIHSCALDIRTEIWLDQAMLEFSSAGSSQKLSATIEPDSNYSVAWTSSDTSVATVSNGVVTAVGPGKASITARIDADTSASCCVLVHSATPLVIPEKTTVIGDEAFWGVDAEEVILPDGLMGIGARAFADCKNLRLIVLPEDIAVMSASAFSGCDGLTLVCIDGSSSEALAEKTGIPLVVLSAE